MAGVDKILDDKEKRSRERGGKFNARRERMKQMRLLEESTAKLISSSDSENSSVENDDGETKGKAA